MQYLLCIFKIDGDIKRLNSFVDFLLTEIWKNFPMSPSFFKRKKLWKVVFGVRCFNPDT